MFVEIRSRYWLDNVSKSMLCVDCSSDDFHSFHTYLETTKSSVRNYSYLGSRYIIIIYNIFRMRWLIRIWYCINWKIAMVRLNRYQVVMLNSILVKSNELWTKRNDSFKGIPTVNIIQEEMKSKWLLGAPLVMRQ